MTATERPPEAVAAPRKRVRRWALSDRQIVYLFLAPTLALLIGMNVFPLIWSLGLSFTDLSFGQPRPWNWVGIANYRTLLADPEKWHHFQNTAAFVVMAVGSEFVLGFGLALLLHRQFRAKGIVTTLLLLPMMLSPSVVGLFWKLILDADIGLFNHLLGLGPVLWLSDPNRVLVALAMIDVWMWTPFVMLIALAGLSAVPQHLYEAAAVDRASAWFRFRYITLPIVSPLLLIAVLFRTMDAFKVFDIVWVTTGGLYRQTISTALYKEAIEQSSTGPGCAFAYVILVVIIALSNLYVRYLTRIRGGL